MRRIIIVENTTEEVQKMSNRRIALVAASIQAGYETQEKLVNALREDGIEINVNTYANIESGRNKYVDVQLTFAICRKVKCLVEEIFLLNATQKVRRGQAAALQQTG